jgi:hypothetical protein
MSFVSASTSSFSDHFTDPIVFASNWTTTGTVSIPVNGSYVTLAANASITSKPLFHHGSLVMNVSLTNQTMTQAFWGWIPPWWSSGTSKIGIFYYYDNSTGRVSAVIGNLTDPASRNMQTLPAYNVRQYVEYKIVWSYDSGYTPYALFTVDGQAPIFMSLSGPLQMIDYMSAPVYMGVNGATSAAKLNGDYVTVSDSIVTVQETTTTSTLTSTATSTATLTSTTTKNTTLTYTSYTPTIITVTNTGTSTSWTLLTSTHTYTAPTYTTVGTSTITGTVTTTSTLTSTTTKGSTTTTDTVTVTGYVVNTSTSTTTTTSTASTSTTSTSTVEAVATVFGFVSLVAVMGVVILIAGVIFATRQRVGFQQGRSNQPV